MFPFALTPEPPYTAVIFTSIRDVGGDEGYAATAARMIELARDRPGYLGVETARDEQTGVGITVSFWTDDWAARAWKEVAEHAEAQRRGREEWYLDYRVYVSTVTRAYGKHRTMPSQPTGRDRTTARTPLTHRSRSAGW